MALGRLLAVVSILLCCTPPSLQYRSCGTGGFEIWNGRCYYFSIYTKTYDLAKIDCTDKGADLISLHSEEESIYVTQKMSSAYRAFWIGLRKDSIDESPLEKNYKWEDGSTKDYTKWMPGEPNDSGQTENCVEQFVNGRTWNDIRCGNYYRYICTKNYAEGWLDYNNHQYYVSFMPEEIESTWYEARGWCMRNGGDLASTLTAEEVTKVAGWGSSNDFTGDLWIGLNKLAGNRDAWGWSDGRPFSNNWNNWATSYPNNGKYGNLCGYQASVDKKGEWKNDHCDKTKGFICKRDKSDFTTPKSTQTTPTVGGFCPAGYIGVGNKCFKVTFPGQKNEGALTFDEALKKCRKEPGLRPTLASIESELDQAFVDAQLHGLRWGVYIGLRRPTFGADWLWVDSSPYKYEHWGPTQPDRSDEHCVEIQMFPGTLGRWNNIKCAEKRGYVCQTYKDPDNVINTSPGPTGSFPCPEGFTEYYKGCYKYQATAYSYDQALSTCKSLDAKATLVGIHRESENAAIQTIAITKNTDLWLGFRDKNDTNVGEYKWEDGWNVVFTLWAGGQPVKESGGGCVTMSPDGKWRDDVCAKQKPSICKISSEDPYTTPATVSGKCPIGDSWFEYAEHCYLISSSTAPWETAKTQCQSKAFRSNLASIHSHAENQMIYDKINQITSYNKNVWIGLYRSQLDRTKMKWTDGGALQYETWAPGEPNGEEDSEDCVEMWNDQWPAQWNDHRCSDYKRYVCKAPKVPHIDLPTPSPHCQSGWKFGFGQCYLFKPDDWVPFEVANSKCQEQDANLISIHDFFENYYIEEEFKLSSKQPVHRPSFWIGMRGMTSKDDSGAINGEWIDGTEVDFTNWLSGPAWTDYTRCVAADVNKAKWSPSTCESHYGFACMKPSSAQTTEDPTSGAGGMYGGAVAGAVIWSILGAMLIAFFDRPT